MRIPSSLLLMILGLVLALPGVAAAHGPERAWDGRYTSLADVTVTTDVEEVDIARQSDNVEFVAHVDVGGPTSDMQFQRREGRQIWKGEVIDAVKDIAVLGGTDVPGASVVDVTDPRNPEILAIISCGGFHSDIAVYENLLLQGWDGSDRQCDPNDPVLSEGFVDAGSGGVRIFDITDPAAPVLIKRYTQNQMQSGGAHNITVNNEAGLLYLNMANFDSVDPSWGFVDLDDPELPLTVHSIRDWSPTAGDGCHDSAILPAGVRPDLAEDAVLYACPGITSSYIWDITDPRNPVEVAHIPNPSIGIHHGGRFSPDGGTLVLGDELAGAAVGAPEASCTAIGGTSGNTTVGATWFYDITVPQAPVPLSTFSVTDTDAEHCTSHFYNFYDQPQDDGGRNLMIGGWYDAGIEIVDYTPAAAGLTIAPKSYAFFEPRDSGFFSAYEYRGFVYGSSFEYGANQNKQSPGRGMWIVEVEGMGDADNEPLAVDEGIVHGRWTADSSGTDLPLGPVSLVDGIYVPFEAHTEMPTDALAIGLVGIGAAGLLPRRRRGGRSADA